MILEIDCGNSLIKWRVFDANSTRVVAFGAAADDEVLIRQFRSEPIPIINRVRLVSVRCEVATEKLVEKLNMQFSIAPEIAKSTRVLAGVKNGYKDYQQLGADRWLAVVAAFSIKGRACLVLDVGTAVTADYVTASGQHLGGYICPGVRLMGKLLSEHTGRISYAPGLAAECASPARTTAAAVECGCMLMLEGFIRTQLTIANEHFGRDFCTILTGGDAFLLAKFLPDSLIIPDLVFRGLAIACPD